MTVLDAIQRSTEFLAQKGVESPRLQIELLLAHVLRLPRLQLYLNYQRLLTETELDSVRELLRRRSRREPLQYIVGSTSFCGLEMTVNPAVLVPRPETELLAERAWHFLNQLSTDSPVALDFGTGSGCIAITLAVKCPGARVFAVDVSTNALELARQNAASHKVAERIEFLVGDGFAAVPRPLPFDLIVSNPPYIPSAEVAHLQPEVREYEPRVALDGGAEGLIFFQRLAVESLPFVKTGSRIMLELGYGQEAAVRNILTRQKWVVEAVEADYTGRPRILTASWPA
ncbi:MAG: peptide chain release factor N(5)-glutamine methyltransferase [Verrucomicrobia bacterium]|nr:MAG: peptide chain release factor N(5)-glutamine methyltransferase [Verrucomicrobiota bacterium]